MRLFVIGVGICSEGDIIVLLNTIRGIFVVSVVCDLIVHSVCL